MRGDRAKRDRRAYLGGHDAARIAGVFQYGAGPADTYARIIHGIDTKLSAAMCRGLWLEHGFANWVEEQRGIKHDRDVFIIDEDVPFFCGSLDGLEPGDEVGHEFKTTTSMNKHLWGVPGTDDVAKTAWIQCQWYMGIHPSIREIHMWCFIVDGDEMPAHYIVTRNQIAIDELRSQSEAFWYDHILARDPPLPSIGSVGADQNDALQALFPRATGNVIEAGAEMTMLAQEYAMYRAAQKIAEDAKDVAAARIKALLGEHQGARWDGGSVSWKERALGEKVNWEQVAHKIGLECGLTGEVFSAVVRDNTFTARSTRALRVNVKGVK